MYDPYDYGGWVVVGGTSVSSPTWAGLIGIANQGRTDLGGQTLGGPTQTLPGLYAAFQDPNAYTQYFHDITQGNNFYPAGPGYDLVTGIGSPRAEGIIPYLTLYQLGPEVTSSNPAQGQVVTDHAADQLLADLLRADRPGSIVASDFTVDGVPADSLQPEPRRPDDHLHLQHLAGHDPGPETMNLPAGSVIGANDGSYNLAPFTSSFYYVTTQLQVVSTSPAVGSVLTVPGHRPGRPVQQGVQPLRHPDQRLPAQPGDGRQRQAADPRVDRPDALGRHSGRHR